MARTIAYALPGTVRFDGAGEQPLSVAVARGYWQRMCGLMGQRDVPLACGLLFPRCASIHTFWMRVPIDVIWLARPESGDTTMAVTGTVSSMEPGRVEMAPHGTWGVLEVRASTLALRSPTSVTVGRLTLGDLA